MGRLASAGDGVAPCRGQDPVRDLSPNPLATPASHHITPNPAPASRLHLAHVWHGPVSPTWQAPWSWDTGLPFLP